MKLLQIDPTTVEAGPFELGKNTISDEARKMFMAPKYDFDIDEYVSYKGETSTFSYTLELRGSDRKISGFGWDVNMGKDENALNNTPKTFVIEMKTDKEVT